MALHAFVAMPFGVKEGIDFNRVYVDYIKPGLEVAGFEVFRADEELRAGEIRKDMFQELLLADLVVVDLSSDNPNVWYELGVRHALRQRGVVLIGARQGRLPFDVVTDRVLRYSLKDGAIDPESLPADIEKLKRCVRETINAWHGWKVSPVYQLLPNLEEPEWKKELHVAGAAEFWERYENWCSLVEIARRRNLPGDILVLAEETPTWVLRLEARYMAGRALMKLKQFRLALEQFEAALAIDPTDLASRQQKGILLGRLGKHAAAREWVLDIVKDHPKDAESWSLLGRIEKEEWISRWRRHGPTPQQMRERAVDEEAILSEAIAPYQAAFLTDYRHFYSGINAVALRHILSHLGLPDASLLSRDDLEGGVRFACLSEIESNPKNYWARATLADLEVFVSDARVVVRAYRQAVAAADDDWFALESSRQQLCLLRDLEFRPEVVNAAIAVFDQELDRLHEPWRPRLVFLFSGHMIDKPDRAEPRLPPEREGQARDEIERKLDELGAGPEDLAICGGACGGDLLFAEACVHRGVKLQLHLPFREPEFLKHSVAFAGESWCDRYYAVKANPLTTVLVMPEELGPAPKDASPYARSNLWQLYTALALGPQKVRFLSLWNREEGDGAGGTKDMVQQVEKHAGRVYILDALWRTTP
jgi:tetratricopeptide (TPR) repeat protein